MKTVKQFEARISEIIYLTQATFAPTLRGYGQSLRFYAREKGKNSRRDNGEPYACHGSNATSLSCMREMELGDGRRFRQRSCTQKRLDGRPHNRTALRCARLYGLRKYSVFQLNSVGLCVGDWTGPGRDAQALDAQVGLWKKTNLKLRLIPRHGVGSTCPRCTPGSPRHMMCGVQT